MIVYFPYDKNDKLNPIFKDVETGKMIVFRSKEIAANMLKKCITKDKVIKKTGGIVIRKLKISEQALESLNCKIF